MVFGSFENLKTQTSCSFMDAMKIKESASNKQLESSRLFHPKLTRTRIFWGSNTKEEENYSQCIVVKYKHVFCSIDTCQQ